MNKQLIALQSMVDVLKGAIEVAQKMSTVEALDLVGLQVKGTLQNQIRVLNGKIAIITGTLPEFSIDDMTDVTQASFKPEPLTRMFGKDLTQTKDSEE